MKTSPIIIKQLGLTDYAETFKSMKVFTDKRDELSSDEIWLTEHFPVFTQGRAGKPEHILNPHTIPIVQSDRGGQVTYHGPGQAILYPLINLKRRSLGVRAFVSMLEESVITSLHAADIDAYADPHAPGVYVDIHNTRHKIASLGLRVRKSSTYHGIALNVNMDLVPFTYINPCGFINMPITQCHDLHDHLDVTTWQHRIAEMLIDKLAQI